MSRTLSSPKSEALNDQTLIELVLPDAVEQLHSAGSVAGDAEFAVLTDERFLELAHPYAKNLVDLGKRTHTSVAPAALPTTIGPFNTGYITFNNGVPVGGFASLTLHSDGTCQFSGHFHDSGAPSYNVEFVWVVVDSAGHAFTFKVNGRMHGTFESGSRDFNWNITAHSPAVAANWGKLCAGWRWRWNAYVNWNVQAALDAVVNAIKAAGTIIAAVIAVV
jgi:hypothetical protein